MQCRNYAEKGKRKAAMPQPPAKRSRNEPSSFPTQLTYPYSDHDDEVETKDIIIIDIQREISRFYNTYLNLSDSLDPLEFYKENKDIYPHLANLARMLFSIPASSVPSECLNEFCFIYIFLIF